MKEAPWFKGKAVDPEADGSDPLKALFSCDLHIRPH